MSHIVLTDDQVRAIDEANGPVELRSRDGRVLARVSAKWTAEEIAAAKRAAANGVWYTSDQVQEYMRLLEEEVARTGRCDEARARELKRQLKPMG